jgi:hypothetical protein
VGGVGVARVGEWSPGAGVLVLGEQAVGVVHFGPEFAGGAVGVFRSPPPNTPVSPPPPPPPPECIIVYTTGK